jgi:hypothetical protein
MLEPMFRYDGLARAEGAASVNIQCAAQLQVRCHHAQFTYMAQDFDIKSADLSAVPRRFLR